VATPPAGGRQPALEVLPGRHQEGLRVHLGQAAQPELPEVVPLSGLAEQRLDPDRPLRMAFL